MKLKLVFFTLFLGLLPLLWFKGDLIITGTDLDFPIYPDQRLQERLYTWFPEIQFGVDRSNNLGSLPYFIVVALFYKLGLGVVVAQKLTFIFWFSLTGFAMLFLMNRILQAEKGRWVFYAKVAAITLYMVNFYNIFLWERLQMAITVLFLVPIFIAILITVLEKNRLLPGDIFLTAIIFIAGGSLGIQPPIIYALALMVVALFIFYVSLDLMKREYNLITSKIKKLIILFSIALFSSGYWLFPLVNFISSSNLFDASTGRDIYNVESLLSWTSNITSFRNVFRQFGDVVWFDGWGGESYFEEFLIINQNPIFIVLSFLSIAAAILALFFNDYKNKKNILALLFITLVTMFFSKGIHPPFEEIFTFLFKNLPGFWIHRAPWQKFAIFYTPGLAVLGGIGIAKGIEFLISHFENLKSKQKTRLNIAIFLVILVIYAWVNQLFILGKMYPQNTSALGYYGKYDLGFHQDFPDYVYSMGDYLDSDNSHFNLLMLPDMHTNVYKWGYAGAADVLNLVTKKGAVFNTYGEGFTINNSADGVYSALVAILYNRGNYSIEDLAGFFNFKYLLQRNDFKYDFFGDTDSPSFIEESLKTAKIDKNISQGDWDLYGISEEKIFPTVYTSVSPIDVRSADTNILHPVLGNINSPEVLISKTEEEPWISDRVFLSLAPEKYEKPTTGIIFDWDSGWSWPEAAVAPNSITYPLVKIKESIRLAQSSVNTDEYLDIILWHSSKRIAELIKFDHLEIEIQESLISQFVEGHKEIVLLLSDDTQDTEDGDGYSDEILKKSASYLQEAIFALDNKEYFFTEQLYELYDNYAELSNTREISFCTGFCYDFDIDIPGSYVLTFNNSNYQEINLDRNTSVITLRKNKDEVLYKGNLSGFPESVNLEKDKYFLELRLPPERDLLDDANIIEVSLAQEDNLLTSVNSLIPLVRTGAIRNIKRFTIENSLGYNKYNLELNYIIGQGKLGVVVFEEGIDGTHTIKHVPKIGDLRAPSVMESIKAKSEFCKDFDTAGCFQEFSLNINTSANSKALHFYLFTYNPYSSETPIILGNLKVTENVEPNLLLESVLPSFIVDSPPSVEFYKISPVKYKVSIKNADKPFYLVFNQTFDRGWKLYKSSDFNSFKGSQIGTYLENKVTEYVGAPDTKLFEISQFEELGESSHYVSNYFGNSWHLDPSALGDSFELTIEFYPQKIFYIGAISSLGALLCAGIYFILSKSRN